VDGDPDRRRLRGRGALGQAARAPLIADAPLSSWKKRGEYDTGYLCEQGRSKSVADLLRDQRQSPDTPRLRPAAAELRYRCERAEHFESLQPH